MNHGPKDPSAKDQGAFCVSYDTAEDLKKEVHKYMCLVAFHGEIPPVEGLEIKEIKSGKVITTFYKGSYSSIPVAYAMIKKEIQEKKYKVNGPPFEMYLNNPYEVQD